MSDPGVKVRQVPEGVAAYQKLISSGFSAQEADNWRSQQTAKLQAGGFKADEIAHYWGDGDANTADIDSHVGNNVAAAVGEEPKVASNPLEMLAAGWDMSVSGLMLKGAPKTVAPQDAGLLDKIAFGAGQLTGDMPAVVTGLIGGAAAGGAAGGAAGALIPVAGQTGVGEVVGGAIGGVAGGGFGSAALPEAMRGVLMDHYEHPNGVLNFRDFMARSSSIAYSAGKAGVIGMVAAPVGGAVGGKVLGATASKGAAALADMGTYTVTATALGGLMDGHVPDATDFATGAALALGFHVGAKVSGKAFNQMQQNMRDVYRKTGLTPGEQVQRAQKDKAFAQSIHAKTPDLEVPPIQGGKADPEPFKANPAKIAAEHEADMTNIGALGAKDAADKLPLNRENQLELVRHLESSGDSAISPKGAVGRYQIMPDTAKQYGLDPTKLKDPEYSKKAADKIIGALASTFKKADGTPDIEAILVAYNAGPGRARAWINGGRDRSKLPMETQRYLEHADRLGGLRDDKPQEFDKNEHMADLANMDEARLKEIAANGPKDAEIDSESVVTREAAQEVLREHQKFDDYDTGNLVDIMRRTVMEQKEPDWINRVTEGRVDGRSDLVAAFVRFRGVMAALKKRGYDFDNLPKEMLASLKERGWNPHDAEEVLKAQLDKLAAQRKPKAIENKSAPAVNHPTVASTPELLAETQKLIANPVEQSLSEKISEQKRRFVFDAISELSPAERIDKAMGKHEDEFGIADAFRQTYGSSGRAWHRLYVGGLERTANEAFSKNEAPPLMSIYDNVKARGGDIQELTAVRIAARTIELQERGVKTPMKVEDATEIMKRLGPKYMEELEIARKANDAKIDDYVDAGMMSKENARKMKSDNRNWFPQVVDKDGQTASRKGGRFGPVQIVKRIKGHEGTMLDPRVQEVKSFYAMAAAADKNRATRALMQALQKEDLSNWGIELKETGEAAIKEADDIMKAIVDGSIDGPRKLAANEFSYFVDGVRHTYEAKDPQIAQMVRGMSPLAQDQTLSAFRWFAKVKRSGITDMPDFIARALAKDAGSSAILNKFGGVPFINTIRGVFHLSKADPAFQDFVANGGLGASLSDMDANWVARDIAKMDKEAGFFGSVINTVAHPLQAAQMIMQRMDAATRIGVKMNAQAKGLSPLKAATEARKASLDFSEKSGSQVLNLLAGIVPFYRPAILGTKQMYEAFRDRPGTTALKSAVYIAAPTAILYAMNYMQDKDLPDGQKFSDLPRWQKDTMFIMPAINGVRIRLPMPPVLGTMVGGMTNRALDHFYKSDPHAFEGWAKTVLANFIPPVIPAAIAPIYEHMANYNSFADAPLIPHSLEDASGYEQFLPSTSEVGKKVASVLGPPGLNITNVSPIVLDNYVRQWTGGLGTAVLRATNAVFNPGKPTELADNPFIGSFFARTPGMSSQSIGDFYDGLEKIKAAHKDLALAVERNDMSDIDFTSKNANAFVELTQIGEALKQQRAAINAISGDEHMTVNEKRQFIDDIASGMVQTAKGGLTVMDSINVK